MSLQTSSPNGHVNVNSRNSYKRKWFIVNFTILWNHYYLFKCCIWQRIEKYTQWLLFYWQLLYENQFGNFHYHRSPQKSFQNLLTQIDIFTLSEDEFIVMMTPSFSLTIVVGWWIYQYVLDQPFGTFSYCHFYDLYIQRMAA